MTGEIEITKEKLECPHLFTEGFYYSRSLQHERYVDFAGHEGILEQRAFENRNDCFPLAINYAMRFPWFTSRSQVVRLMQKRCKISLEDAKKKKVDGGVPASAFKDFYLKDNLSHSLVKLPLEYDILEGKGKYEFIEFLDKEVLGEKKYSAVLLAGKAKGRDLDYSHCIAFVRASQAIVVQDFYAKELLWYPKTPADHSGEKVDVHALLDNYWFADAFVIEERIVNAAEWTRIDKDLTYVMTGKKDKDEIFLMKSEAAESTHDKTKMTLYKRRKCGLQLKVKPYKK